MEAALKSHKLLVDAHTETPLYIQTHILFLVLIGDFDVLTVGLKLVVSDATKSIVIHCKGLVKHIIYVIVTVVKKRGREERKGGREGEKRGKRKGRDGGRERERERVL